MSVAMLISGLISGAAMAQDLIAPTYILDSYGVYCGIEGPKQKLAAPGTVLGYIQVTEADTTATVQTTRVPAALGLSFGVSIRLAEEQSNTAVEFRVTHPTGRPGERITERWTTQLSGAGPSLNRFAFDYPEELILGLWVLEVVQAGEVVLRKSFDVVAPEAAADVLSQCSGYTPVS
ncbi:DUF3859 domain-containing protein [Rhodobacteraceae bacterium D3-12]|nr:DUF3859 domain-containing protein [Rhodobacteraceae bacterium D3-12]